MSVRKKPLVVVTRKLPDSIETRMRELFDARLNLDDAPLTPEQIAEAVRTADVLVPTVTDEITEELLKQPDCKLRLIANFGNGVDNIDVVAAHARGITVTNTPGVLTEDTADMTMALILALPRRLTERAMALRNPRIHWAGWQTEPGPYFQMADLVVFPSLEEETLGNVILEAWTWSRPLVTSLFRGAREIARHGEDAWCLPCGDARALAEGIGLVLGDDRLRQELAQAGQARVQAEFARGPIMAQYRDLYRQLLGAGS